MSLSEKMLTILLFLTSFFRGNYYEELKKLLLFVVNSVAFDFQSVEVLCATFQCVFSKKKKKRRGKIFFLFRNLKI
jgi:hypothetical protein